MLSDKLYQPLSCFLFLVSVPTFVGFLADIESPFEVTDYVRDYLGESKHSNEFARQFIAKRISLRAENNNKHQEVLPLASHALLTC